MTLLQRLQILFVRFYGAFQLFDVFRPSFSKRSLRLPIALFALFGRRVDLNLTRQQLLSNSLHIVGTNSPPSIAT